MVTNMPPTEKDKERIPITGPTLVRIPAQKDLSNHGDRHRARRKTPSLTALVIIAIALALLLVSVIIIGTTRLQTSSQDAPTDNTTVSTQPGPPPPTVTTEPPGGDQGLSWCQAQGEGNSLNSSLPETVVILIHGITGPTDEFWYNGTHYSDGWFWQNPAPVWYETEEFRCL
ncbi:hypothetical protein J7T55_002617 [Diaporthe amygdali]|uniref:uncharacterized protein n=1 Tax=Phomopsis amygdali TaxID=1214568 RepID=UPI0022FF2E41|nr:uncharacterized protein J7T55_002617 [Diaporthe amygdali]KAJ0122105.1 hypothetical protein J7T55_002617 [Diaporthe amygdali]